MEIQVYRGNDPNAKTVVNLEISTMGHGTLPEEDP